MKELIITLAILGVGALVLVLIGIGVLIYGADREPSIGAGLFILGLACILISIGITDYCRWVRIEGRKKENRK
jgi:Na+/phosphate symporter